MNKTLHMWDVITRGVIAARDRDAGCIAVAVTNKGKRTVELYFEEPPGVWHHDFTEKVESLDALLSMRVGCMMIADHLRCANKEPAA